MKGTDLDYSFTWGAVQVLLIPSHLSRRKNSLGFLISSCYIYICCQGNYIHFDTQSQCLIKNGNRKKKFWNKQPYFFLHHNLSRPITLAGELTHAMTLTSNGEQKAGQDEGEVQQLTILKGEVSPLSAWMTVSTRCGTLCRGGGLEDALIIWKHGRIHAQKATPLYSATFSMFNAFLKKWLLSHAF